MIFLQAQGYPDFWEMLLRLLIACICGFAIGLERSMRFKVAGLRTHIITCFASALFMLISKYGFLDLMEVYGDKPADYARIAAGVVSGISFLCAGVIYKTGPTIHGLTTAVGLWLTSAIGLSIGAGMYGVGVIGAVLMIGIQSILHHKKFGTDSFNYTDVKIVVKNDMSFADMEKFIIEKTAGTLEDISAEHGVEDSTYEFILRTKNPINADDMRKLMATCDGIISLSHKPLRKS